MADQVWESSPEGHALQRWIALAVAAASLVAAYVAVLRVQRASAAAEGTSPLAAKAAWAGPEASPKSDELALEKSQEPAAEKEAAPVKPAGKSRKKNRRAGKKRSEPSAATAAVEPEPALSDEQVETIVSALAVAQTAEDELEDLLTLSRLAQGAQAANRQTNAGRKRVAVAENVQENIVEAVAETMAEAVAETIAEASAEAASLAAEIASVQSHELAQAQEELREAAEALAVAKAVAAAAEEKALALAVTIERQQSELALAAAATSAANETAAVKTRSLERTVEKMAQFESSNRMLTDLLSREQRQREAAEERVAATRREAQATLHQELAAAGDEKRVLLAKVRELEESLGASLRDMKQADVQLRDEAARALNQGRRLEEALMVMEQQRNDAQQQLERLVAREEQTIASEKAQLTKQFQQQLNSEVERVCKPLLAEKAALLDEVERKSADARSAAETLDKRTVELEKALVSALQKDGALQKAEGELKAMRKRIVEVEAAAAESQASRDEVEAQKAEMAKVRAAAQEEAGALKEQLVAAVASASAKVASLEEVVGEKDAAIGKLMALNKALMKGRSSDDSAHEADAHAGKAAPARVDSGILSE